MTAVALPILLSILAGYVDTAGFLALQGLFTAHVTGNFVTLGAALVMGTSGILAKLLALPVFAAVVAMTRLGGLALARFGAAPLRWLLGCIVVLLVAFAALAMRFGPFPDGDSASAILTGMTGVAAMAVQNAAQRLYLSSAPPSTLMTGNTTQLVIDAVDRAFARAVPDASVTSRLRRMGAQIAGFAAGCAAAALLFALLGMACFIVPPLIGLAALLAQRRAA